MYLLRSTRFISIVVFAMMLLCLGCRSVMRSLHPNGAEFNIRIIPAETDKDLPTQHVVDVIRNKLNLIGIQGEVEADPAQSGLMTVRVYDPPDLQRIKKFLFNSFRLEIRKAVSPPNPAPLQTYDTEELARTASKAGETVFRYQAREAGTSGNQFVILEDRPILTGEHVRDAAAVKAPWNGGGYGISFALDSDGAKAFGDWTGRNIGNYLAIVLDQKVQSVAFIKSQIFDNGQIEGRFTKEDAEDVALGLKSGYLPATLEITSERQLGN